MPWSNQAHEPQLLSLHVWSLCSATGEAVIVRGPRTAMKSGPRLPQLEKALAQKRRPNTAKNKKIKKKDKTSPTLTIKRHKYCILFLYNQNLQIQGWRGMEGKKWGNWQKQDIFFSLPLSCAHSVLSHLILNIDLGSERQRRGKKEINCTEKNKMKKEGERSGERVILSTSAQGSKM